MGRKKLVGEADVIEEGNEEVAETVEESTENAAYIAFQALIEAYKAQNPVKYEQKKAALEDKLNSLK